MKNMISYYLNILKIKLKYAFTYLYFDLYKSYVNIFLSFFRGPHVNYSFFDGSNDILLETFNSDSRKASVISPFFIFILINHGFWYIFNLNLWLGSNVLTVKPRLNILSNNIRTVPLKYNRKRYIYRILSYHLSVLERVWFLKLIILLFLFEIYLIFFFYNNFNDFCCLFILLFYFLIPFFYLRILNIYKYLIKYFSIGIKLIFLKPVSFSPYNIKKIKGDLNLGNAYYDGEKISPYTNFYIKVKRILSFRYLKFTFRKFFKSISKINIKSDKKLYNRPFNAYFDKLYRRFNFRLKTKIERFKENRRKSDFDLFNSSFDFNVDFNLEHIWRRLFFSTDKDQKFISLFINFNLIRKIAILYFDHLKLLIESENFFMYLKKLFFKYRFFFFFLLLCQICIYIYNLFFYNLIFFLLIFFFIIIDYIIYKKNLSKIKSLFLECYLINYDINYNLDLILCINAYNKFREYNIIDFTMLNYLSLLKIELNISIFESILNDSRLEMEYFYDKHHIVFDNDYLDLKSQAIMSKYFTIFNNLFNRYKGKEKDSNALIEFMCKDLILTYREKLEDNVRLFEKMFLDLNFEKKEEEQDKEEKKKHKEFKDFKDELFDLSFIDEIYKNHSNKMVLLENKIVYNKNKINVCEFSDFNIHQQYYYTKYGVKLINIK